MIKYECTVHRIRDTETILKIKMQRVSEPFLDLVSVRRTSAILLGKDLITMTNRLRTSEWNVTAAACNYNRASCTQTNV